MATPVSPQSRARYHKLSPSLSWSSRRCSSVRSSLPEAEALRRGRQVHLLLEHLPLWPEADWPALASALLATEEATLAAEAEAVLHDAAAVLRAPHLAHLFAPTALAEVGIAAPLPELAGQSVLGSIDRLLLTPTTVLAIDFKSNAAIPPDPASVPLGLLRQMGAYAAALAQIYPGRRIETAILWTRTTALMPLPTDLVMAALRSAIP